MKTLQNLRKIENLIGQKVFIVGGAVRDLILKKKPKDIDIASTAVPEEVIEKLKDEFKVIPTGIDHGTVTIVDKESGFAIEHTTFRKDIKTDGRKSVVEFTNNIIEDLSRRDFTINAMAISLDGKFIDFFKGRVDIQRKIIRTVGNPEDRFKEDFLRIVRALRFAVKLGFTIENETLKAIEKLAPDVEKNVSAERIRDELVKANSPWIAGWMSRFGIWKDLTKNWFKIDNNPTDILVELAIFSDLDVKNLDKFKLSKHQKKLVSLFRHALNGNWKVVHSARHNDKLIKDLKVLMKRHKPDLVKNLDRALKISPKSKQELVDMLAKI